MNTESVTYDVLDKIAELILQDPSVSVRELARRLGYAEEKTIYYWLSKRGFHGIRPFKRAVLTGHYRHGLNGSQEGPRRLGRLPVVSRLSRAGEPFFTGATLPVTLDRGRGLYVLAYDGPPGRAIAHGDFLVVGPLDLEAAEVVLVQTEETGLAVRQVLHPQSTATPLLFDWASCALDEQSVPRGSILQVLRVLKPAMA
jgi:hypothetical protein